MLVDVEAILKICGVGSYLQIGCGKNTLVHDLLKRSMDAYGMDADAQIVAHHEASAPGRFFHSSVKDYPFERKIFDTIIIGTELLNFSQEELAIVLVALQCMVKRNLVLYFSPESAAHITQNSIAANRLFWEGAMIRAGFRKHTRSMLVNSYQELENENINRVTFFECVPDLALQQYSLGWLAENRDLHMDMLREAGRRSDGHVSRYVLAASLVRPGDVVLDAACGLGYGTAVLASCSPGSKFIGVDIDQDSTDYANANYAEHHPTLSYQVSDVTTLSFLADHSVDMIVSFETIEHVPDYEILLKEFKRILKPDGRFIGSVPNLWCDETGNDPNPYHFHVFDWKKLHAAINKYFIVDGRWSQTAGGGYRLNNGRREMDSIPLAQNNHADCEWWIISACGNPLEAKSIPYTNSFNRQNNLPTAEHVNFEKYYDNPWIYRVMVQLGERLIDRDVLFDFCSKVEKDSRIGSADHGAALCVLCYQLFESNQINLDYFTAIVERINLFENSYDRNNIHAYRWLVSLNYIAARLLLMIGNRDEALKTFLVCAELDPLGFSPLLATKTILSRFYAGIILVSDGKIDAAKEQFTLGVKESHRVLQGDWATIIGTSDDPLIFGLPEAAEVLEIASQCAQSLKALDRHETSPGYFWSRINLRKFGLLEWNKHLERENEVLRRRPVNVKMPA
jgi:2-polyprenyl-3-methyl-5-hydroxy-6-metoxy-1,4-benzoquinol methylase